MSGFGNGSFNPIPGVNTSLFGSFEKSSLQISGDKFIKGRY